MIIDLILDRKDGKEYNPKNFYNGVASYGEIGNEIADQLDEGEEQDIKKALCDYILINEYNPNLCDYINSMNWI